MALPRLIYFAARGRAEIIRLALAEAGVAYEDDTFTIDQFPAMKASGRLPFQAVPVWEEDDFRLAQSHAILNHIARTHGLYGSNAREQAKIDEAIGAVEDVRGELRKLMPAAPEKRPEIRAELTSNTLPRWFAMLEKHLASNEGGNGFVAGKSLSIADLALYYLLEMCEDNGFGPAFADAKRLRAFKERIAARPKIAAWLASPKRFPLQKLPG